MSPTTLDAPHLLPSGAGTERLPRRWTRLLVTALLLLMALATLAVTDTGATASAATPARSAVATDTWCIPSGYVRLPYASVKTGGALWASLQTAPRLYPLSARRNAYSAVLSNDGRYMLELFDDGHLVLVALPASHSIIRCGGGQTSYWVWQRQVPVWWSTVYSPGAYAEMQADGNFVLYAYDSRFAVWSTQTGGRALSNRYHLAVQGDGNLVVYYGAQPLWDRNGGVE